MILQYEKEKYMDNIKKALIKDQMTKRLAMVLIGQVIMGLSVVLLRRAALGTDPYSAMMLALTNLTSLSYGTFCAIGNCFFFVIEIIWGRKFIGFGTLANWFLLGYAVDMWEFIFSKIGIVSPEQFTMKLILCVVSIVVFGFSISIYQSGDIGTSPFDSLPLTINHHLHIPFFISRVLCDGMAALIAIVAGGVIGIASVVFFLSIGPIVGFFNTHYSEKLLK